MNIPSSEFWSNEEQRYWDEVAEITLEVLLAGGAGGAELLPEAVRILLNWDVFNHDAIDFLDVYRLNTVAGISASTRNQAIEVIGAWIRSGEPLPMLEARLTPLFGSARASRIAVTEVTRVYAKGNVLAWEATGVVSGMRWATAMDEKVCPLCGPLHGEIVSIDGIFIQTPTDIASSPQMQALVGDAYDKAMRKAEQLLRWNGAYIDGPPRHPNCLPGDSLVSPIGGVTSGSKRWYEGDVVTIGTAENNLAVTPNHPVLTNRGWLSAHKIKKGDYVVCDNYDIQGHSTEINKKNMIPTIENVFSSLGLEDFRVPVSAPDFHNDGANSKIAIIRPNGKVTNRLDPVGAQPISEGNLINADVVRDVALPGLCPHGKFSVRGNSASDGLMGGANLGTALGVVHSRPLGEFGFGSSTWGDTVVNQALSESPTIDADFISKGLFGLSGLVSLQEVIKVGNVNFSGHVYNLQTNSGLYVADGIITHNCRCWLQPIVSEELFRESLRQLYGYFGDLEVEQAVSMLRAWTPEISVVRY